MSVTDAKADYVTAYLAAVAALRLGRDPIAAAHRAISPSRECDWIERLTCAPAIEAARRDWGHDTRSERCGLVRAAE